MKEAEKLKHEIESKIELIKRAIEANEAADLPTEYQYRLLYQFENNLTRLEAEMDVDDHVSEEEVELKSPEKELINEIEQVKHAISVNESFDIPADNLYSILTQKEGELEELRATSVKEEEDHVMSPFRGHTGQTVKDCYIECSKTIEDIGLGSLGHCSGCDLHCQCLGISPNVVIMKNDSESIWIRIKEGKHETV